MLKLARYQVNKLTRFIQASSFKLPASIVCFAIYSVVAILFTWPLVSNLSTSTYGYSGDNFGFMYYLWRWKYTRAQGLDLSFSHLEEAPFGKIIYPETGNIAFFWPVKLLTLLTNGVAGYNLLLLLSFPLAGLAMYLLCREVLRDRSDRSGIGHKTIPNRNSEFAAFVGGLIFAFSPYHLWKAYNHLDLCLIYVIPLFLWAWIRFERSLEEERLSQTDSHPELVSGSKTSEPSQPPRFRNKFGMTKEVFVNAVVLGLAAFLTVMTNYYYAFFTGLMAIGLFVGKRLKSLQPQPKTLRDRYGLSLELFKGYVLALLLAVVLSLPFIKTALSGLRGSSPYGKSDIYDRPLENLLLLSARPWDYLIPSQDHPVFGSLAKNIHKKIESLSNDFKTQPGPPHERTIFLGYFTISFAMIAPISLRLRELFKSSRSPREVLFEFTFPFWFTIALLVFLSFPPFIYLKGTKILFPTFFLHQIFPMFRSYSRLGLYVLALMIPLAVISFNQLLRRVGHPELVSGSRPSKPEPTRFRNKFGMTKQAAVTCIASAFVLFEFLNFPPAKIIDFSEIPPSYQWLADQKKELIIAEYPKLFSLADGYMFQRIHMKPIFNPHGWSPYYELWDWVEDFYDEGVANKLAALGVRYVLVHKELLFPQENPVDELWFTRALTEPLKYDEIPKNLVLIEDFEETAIFEIKVDPEPMMGVIFEENDQFVVSWSKKEWSWNGKDNKIYLMNLADREAAAAFSFVGSGGLDRLAFNGSALTVEKSDDTWELSLRPGENIVQIISDVPYQFLRMPKIEF